MENNQENETVSYPVYDLEINEFNLSKLNDYKPKENPSFNDLQSLLSELKPLEIKEL
jgi:hypothetical protein